MNNRLTKPIAMKLKLLSFYALIILMLGSCSTKLRYFTQDMYDTYRWNQQELKSIQFYLSEDIVLWRKLGNEDARIKDGKIKVTDDSEIEEVFIKKGTPGLVLFIPKKNKFAISFDKNDNHYLVFGPNPKASDRYVLLAKEWDRRKGKVSYGKRIYNTDSESAFASLMVDIKSARKVKYRSKTASGRKI